MPTRYTPNCVQRRSCVSSFEKLGVEESFMLEVEVSKRTHELNVQFEEAQKAAKKDCMCLHVLALGSKLDTPEARSRTL